MVLIALRERMLEFCYDINTIPPHGGGFVMRMAKLYQAWQVRMSGLPLVAAAPLGR